MNRTNVPYIIAAALLVLAVGGWGIFLTGLGHPEPAVDSPDAATSIADAGTSDAALTLAATPPTDADVQLAPTPPPPDANPTPIPPNVTLEPSDVGLPLPAVDTPDTARPEPADKNRETSKSSKSEAKEAIGHAVNTMRPALRVCYRNLLDEFPDASGKIKVTFRIEADTEGDGRVSIVEVLEESTLMDDKLQNCVTDAFQDVDFPLPEGQDALQVTYPFNFQK